MKAKTRETDKKKFVGDLYTSALIYLGLILFGITFVILAAARYMLMRLDKGKGV